MRRAQEPPPLGIWNGKEFVFTASKSSWRTVIDSVWRWGVISTTKSRNLALSAADKFGSNYDMVQNDQFGFESVVELLEALHLNDTIAISARDYFVKYGINDKFLSEFIEVNAYSKSLFLILTIIMKPATRVNYGQNLDLNALAALVCLTAAFVPSESIGGGNYLIFKEMIHQANPTILLNHKVTELSVDEMNYIIRDDKGNIGNYDAVIMAVPSNSVYTNYI